MTTNSIAVGVIGVGAMGRHHARVYQQLSKTVLVGIFDVDEQRAREVAEEHNTSVMRRDALLEAADAVSIAVPTEYHFDLIMACLEKRVPMLVEKPVLQGMEGSEELIARVEETDVPVQVGHIERYNPAILALEDQISDLTIDSIRTHRLGPPPERDIKDSAVLDLMIHDIDIVLSLLGKSPSSISASGVQGGRHASALLEFGDDTMASLTASRRTQRKVRTLAITAEECFIELDYLDQSIEIHRNSLPEYIEKDGEVRFTHQNIVERPKIDSTEPLQNELEAFVRTVENGMKPDVTVEDGLEALSVALEIERRTERQSGG